MDPASFVKSAEKGQIQFFLPQFLLAKTKQITVVVLGFFHWRRYFFKRSPYTINVIRFVLDTSVLVPDPDSEAFWIRIQGLKKGQKC